VALATILAAAVRAADQSTAQIDIYILAGQSNMVRVAPLEGEPAPEHSTRIWMMNSDDEFEEASDPLDQLAPGQKLSA
jgi:Carbohydrate esterase, sialic acid-specific acetylesterase